MNFHEYREVFYFLQYQFYIRGEKHRNELEHAANTGIEGLSVFSDFPVFNFLRNLAESANEIHYAWDVVKCQRYPQPAKKIQVKRPPRGMKKEEAEGRLPVSSGNIPVMLFPHNMPDFPEDECKYMVFAFPKGHRKNQIPSMYKSLLVHDAVAHGFKKGNIVEAFRQERIESLISLRNLSLYEFIPDVAVFRFPAETLILRDLFGSSLFSATEKNAGTSLKSNFIKEREVDRYLTRAYNLIQIAETGYFKEYPHHLK